MPRYHELLDDRTSMTRWHLSEPLDDRGQEIDPWLFRDGKILTFETAPRFSLDEPGEPLDFSWAAFAVPVVHARFAQLFQRLGINEVQFIPAQVEGQAGPYYILNTLRVVRCIDDARCTEVRYWKPEHNQPEKLGKYRLVVGLRIDPSNLGSIRVFRTWGWSIALIVSEDIKRAIEAEGFTGTRFVAV